MKKYKLIKQRMELQHIVLIQEDKIQEDYMFFGIVQVDL